MWRGFRDACLPACLAWVTCLNTEHVVAESFLPPPHPNTSGPMLQWWLHECEQSHLCPSPGRLGESADMVGWICPCLGSWSLPHIPKRSHITSDEVQRDHVGPLPWNVSSQLRSTHSASWTSLIISQLSCGGISQALHEETQIHALLSANLCQRNFH